MAEADVFWSAGLASTNIIGIGLTVMGFASSFINFLFCCALFGRRLY